MRKSSKLKAFCSTWCSRMDLKNWLVTFISWSIFILRVIARQIKFCNVENLTWPFLIYWDVSSSLRSLYTKRWGVCVQGKQDDVHLVCKEYEMYTPPSSMSHLCLQPSVMVGIPWKLKVGPAILLLWYPLYLHLSFPPLKFTNTAPLLKWVWSSPAAAVPVFLRISTTNVLRAKYAL